MDYFLNQKKINQNILSLGAIKEVPGIKFSEETMNYVEQMSHKTENSYQTTVSNHDYIIRK